MTKALYAVNHVSLGGVYYCDDFTLTGAQPVWTKLTTTGLADLRVTHFQVDPDDPINRQYVRTADEKIYTRNGGNWTEILNKTICQAVTGVAGDNLYYLWADPTISGRVYAVYAKNGFPANDFVMKSVDYGANWTSIQILDNENISTAAEAIGDVIFNNGDYSITNAGQVYYSQDGGATQYQSKYGAGGSGPGYIHINPQNTNLNFADTPGIGSTIVKFTLAGGVLGATGTTVPAFIESQLYIPTDEGTGVMYCVVYAVLYTTANNFTAWTSVMLGGLPVAGEEIALTGEANQTGTVMAFGNNDSGGMWMVDSGADTTPTNRAGANYGTPPYTDSLPTAPTAIYGIWFGLAPASKGIYLYSVEEGDINNIPDADNLGLPLFGDRSSWRDYDADDDGDGTELSRYHAQDIRDDMPQRHNPWPATNGQAPVSDGSIYIATDIITQAEFDYSFYVVSPHCPVTLDADAQLVLDLGGSCGQEIGLDTQQPTYVFIGPSFMPPDEPTFRPMYIEELANVTTTAPVLDGEVLTFDGGSGQWVNDEPARHNRIVTTLTAGTYTLDDTYDVVVLDATAGDITINLPNTSSNDGLEYAFKRIDATANIVSIMPADTTLLDSDGEILTDSDGETLEDSDGGGGDTIDGETVQYLDSQYLAIQIVADADGSAWWII